MQTLKHPLCLASDACILCREESAREYLAIVDNYIVVVIDNLAIILHIGNLCQQPCIEWWLGNKHNHRLALCKNLVTEAHDTLPLRKIIFIICYISKERHPHRREPTLCHLLKYISLGKGRVRIV